jgi:UDP-N-acetylmuramate--alanine ligase
VTDIYASRESPIDGVDSNLIVDSAHKQGFNNVFLVRDMYEVPEFLTKELNPGDVVLILGAGNINRIAEPLLRKIQETAKDG